MAVYGADIEALEGLATRFANHKETIVGLIYQVAAELDSVLWEGPDAEVLRPDWADRLSRVLSAIDDTFSTIAAEASAQAVEQRDASGI